MMQRNNGKRIEKKMKTNILKKEIDYLAQLKKKLKILRYKNI